MLRPGPYICAEWDFGGLPWFLLADDNMQLRTFNAPYLSHVDRWLTALYKKLNQHNLFYSQGGPIVLVQVCCGAPKNLPKTSDELFFSLSLSRSM
jgi:beta-galactosidase